MCLILPSHQPTNLGSDLAYLGKDLSVTPVISLLNDGYPVTDKLVGKAITLNFEGMNEILEGYFVDHKTISWSFGTGAKHGLKMRLETCSPAELNQKYCEPGSSLNQETFRYADQTGGRRIVYSRRGSKVLHVQGKV